MRTKSSGRTTATTPEAIEGVRLQKFLAAAGIASRREAERMIQGGRVEVNGRIVTVLGTRVEPDRDTVRVDGRRVRGGGRRVYFLLHKPRGFITSASDPQGRPTVLDLLPGIGERVFPVGRLDWNTEGLLILTNDGDLAYRLTHPTNHVPKVYRVKVKGAVPTEVLEAVRRGLYLDGRKSLPARVTRVSSQVNSWLEVVLYEGQKNQIRRTFERLGHPVLKLRRIAIGPISDRLLKPGEFRPLTESELTRLKEGA
ncbi:MAG TPA: pseudouridine synthase [Candidatus Polarisedimenticolia bacterium]|nr:pseudouridine synthase [Candidatus Polarisedimenticolia bacterium]